MDGKLIVFDTTLRDGEQSPGASMTAKEKVEIALQLEKLGVDVIEAGFPIASLDDFAAVKDIASNIKNSTVCGLARAINKDIDAVARAIKPAKHGRIHVFLATSRIHMKYKLKKAEEEILKQAKKAVKYARRFSDDIEFSPEDASRTEPEFLFQVLEEVIKAGATTLNIPDTVGYAVPEQYGQLFSLITNNVPNINKAILSCHCHDDLGLAVSNSLAALANGARQVECTINGIGERAGSASLEEVVMAIKTRKDYFGLNTAIKTEQLYRLSKLVSKLTGIAVAPNKAVIGANAFSHESGIHQDGILKKRATYEIMKPADVGFKETKLVLGKHSGRHAFREHLKGMGYPLKDKDLDNAFSRFKALADKKKTIFDDDLLTIIEDDIRVSKEIYQLTDILVQSGTSIKPKVRITIKKKNKADTTQATGDGPVDACYKAIDKIIKIKGKLIDYSIQAVTSGKDALGEVHITIRIKDRIYSGRGASTDIIEASAKAYLAAINRYFATNKR